MKKMGDIHKKNEQAESVIAAQFMTYAKGNFDGT